MIKNSLKRNSLFVNPNANFHSTDLHNKSYIFNQSNILQSFPVFQENLHCVQIWPKIKHGKILKSDPLIKWQSMKISVLFHSFAHLALPFWVKRIPENFSTFPGKFTLCEKRVKN